jgi:hypothetical protein
MTGRRLVTTALLLAAPALVAAQTGLPELRVTLDPAVITVGDPVVVVVTVTHDPDARVVWPEPIDLGAFELLDVQLSDATTDGDRAQSRAELTVTAFELGDQTVPAFEVAVIDGAGETVMLSTEAAAVTIESVGRDESGDIRDIKAPLAIPFGVATLLPWLAGLAVLGGAAYWLYRRYRRRVRPEVVTPVAPPRPAHEIAHESLAALEASGLLALGEVKTYHIRGSDIMRVYAENRFGIDAMEMTTGEVLEALRRCDAASGVVAEFRQLLDRCDLVKFAKFRPEVPDCRDLVPLGRRLVDATTPADPSPVDTPVEAEVA